MQLKWYYLNRVQINLSLSKPKGIEDDEGDMWLEHLETRKQK